MGQKRSRATSRAWRLLRIALLWARKGGILKCRLMAELRHVNKHLKALHRHSSSPRLDSTAFYAERELSFDETPILRIGMSRPGSLRFKLPNIPCIKPSVVDFDYEFDDEIYGRKTSLIESEVEDEEEDCEYECYDYDADLVEEEEEGIDEKADEFIARFHRQMKMQRQASYLQYQEMLCRGTC